MSLKYRLALIVFLLECGMVAVVLWQVSAVSLESGRAQLDRTYRAAISSLADAAAAMPAGRAGLQAEAERIARDPNVATAMFLAADGRVAASSRGSQVGSPTPRFADSGDRFWLTRPYAAGAGRSGLVALEISTAPVVAAARRARERGIVAALAGMLVIAGVGVYLGAGLNRRFARLAAVLGVSEDDARGVPAALTGTDEIADLGRVFDVMAERLAERRRELRESEQLLRLCMDAVPVAIVYIDRDLSYRLTNKAFESWFGMTRSELHGRHPEEVIGEEAFRLVSERMRATPAGRPVTYEMTLPYKHAGERYVMGSAVPNLDEDGEVLGYFVAINDLTERRKAEEAVVEARDAAQQADAAKTRFLAAASHDLRQPLHAMRLLTGVLADRATEAKDREILGELEVSLHSMDGMLSALLDISKFDSAAVTPDIGQFHAGGLLRRVAAEFAPEARDKGLDLRVVPCSAVVRSDPALLERILANLVSNALRYTVSGKVLLGCRRRGPDLRIEVWDTGIGIAEDQMTSIFEEYYQIGNRARDRSLGLGLGLSLVDRIARLLGHRIDASSTPGKGSVFAVEVPRDNDGSGADRGAGSANPPRDRDALAGRTVFVIEDDALGLAAMRTLLEGWGAAVIEARDGGGVARRLAEPGFDCDLVITDQWLPRGDAGTAVVRRIRESLGRDVPAIVVTGDASDDVRRDALAAGCLFARKPIDTDLLSAMVRQLLHGTAPHSASRLAVR